MPQSPPAPRRGNALTLTLCAKQAQTYYNALYQRYMTTHAGLATAPPAYAQRRACDGNTIWMTLVQHAQRHNTTATMLLAVLFADWSGREPPRPHHALSAALLPVLADFTADALSAAELQLQADRQTYERQLCLAQEFERRQAKPRREMELVSEVLASDATQLSPLFRYCVARQLKLSAVIDAVRAQADAQFLSFPPAYLRTAWRKLLTRRHAVAMAAQYT